MDQRSYELRNYDDTLMHFVAYRDDYGQEFVASAEMTGNPRLLLLQILRAVEDVGAGWTDNTCEQQRLPD